MHGRRTGRTTAMLEQVVRDILDHHKHVVVIVHTVAMRDYAFRLFEDLIERESRRGRRMERGSVRFLVAGLSTDEDLRGREVNEVYVDHAACGAEVRELYQAAMDRRRSAPPAIPTFTVRVVRDALAGSRTVCVEWTTRAEIRLRADELARWESEGGRP